MMDISLTVLELALLLGTAMLVAWKWQRAATFALHAIGTFLFLDLLLILAIKVLAVPSLYAVVAIAALVLIVVLARRQPQPAP